MRARCAPLVAALLAAGGARADQAEIALPTALAARVVSGAHSGLSVALEAGPGGALVTVSEAVRALALEPAYPLAGRDRCGDRDALAVPARFALPAELAPLLGRPAGALAVVVSAVEFVTQRIAPDESDARPQDARSVLARGRGRCSGRANLAVGLLRALGIPARPVQGLVLDRAGARWHRWGEAWLGPLGWVPFDPGGSVGMVSVRYLPLAGAGSAVSLDDARLVRLDERGFLGVLPRDGLRVLPAGGVTLRCVPPSSRSAVTALLLGPDGTRWARRGRGELVFARMLPGRYRLVWRGSGRSGSLELALGAANDVLVELGSEGGAGS